MSRVSPRIDGLTFEEFRVRHTGTVVVEEDQVAELALGEVVVTVNVGTVGDLQAKLDKDGKLARVAVLKQNETVVLEGEIKQLLVERLGLYGGDTMPPPIKITPGERTPSQRAAKEASGTALSLGSQVLRSGAGVLDEQAARELLESGVSVSVTFAADDETGEIDEDTYDEAAERAAWESSQGVEEEAEESEGPETVFSPGGGVERLGSVPSMAPEANSRPATPQGPSAFVPVAGGGQTIGRIVTKDPALANALDSDSGWS